MPTTAPAKFLPKSQAAEQLALVQSAACPETSYHTLRRFFGSMTVADQRRHATVWIDHYTEGRRSFIKTDADAEAVAVVAFGY